MGQPSAFFLGADRRAECVSVFALGAVHLDGFAALALLQLLILTAPTFSCFFPCKLWDFLARVKLMRPHNELILVGILLCNNRAINHMPMCILTVADGGMGQWADAMAEVTADDGGMIMVRLLLIMVIYDSNLDDPTD